MYRINKFGKRYKVKILLVDDNRVKLLACHKIIKKRLNIKSEMATHHEAALRKFRKYRHNIIVLDILMPEKDGFQVASDIARYCRKKHLKIPHMISYTVLEGEAIQAKAINCGIDDYVPKTNPEELIKVIEKWLMFDNKSFAIY